VLGVGHSCTPCAAGEANAYTAASCVAVHPMKFFILTYNSAPLGIMQINKDLPLAVLAIQEVIDLQIVLK
jgi:hypothetical protein